MLNLSRFYVAALLSPTWTTPARAEVPPGPCQVAPDLPPGFVTVGSKGAARVYRGRDLLGETPLYRHKLPAGCVELRLESVTSNEVLSFRVTVEPNRVSSYDPPFPKDAPVLSPRPTIVPPEVREGLCQPNPHVGRAPIELASVAYLELGRTLSLAITAPDTCREDLIAIHVLKGISDAISDEPERCREAFATALSLDPKFTMPPTFPKIERCLDAARAIPENQRTLTMSVHAAQFDPSRAVYNVPVTLVDPRRLVENIEVFARPRGEVDYWRLSVRRNGDTASIEIPAFAPRPGAKSGIEYVVAGTDRWGGRLLISGSYSRPLTASP